MAKKNPSIVLNYAFMYDGSFRVVSDVTLEDDNQTIIGMEVYKDGFRSDQIKRYSLSKTSNLTRLDEIPTSGGLS